MNTPTDQEKIELYEQLFHQINAAILIENNQRIEEILTTISDWSYAHRSGNEELTDEEQQERINYYFKKMKKLAG